MVAQAGTLLLVDVSCIVAASTLPLPGSHKSQALWFLKAPSGAFVLDTAIGKRDIMHIFIEVLLIGIAFGASIAVGLICRMRQKRQLHKKTVSKNGLDSMPHGWDLKAANSNLGKSAGSQISFGARGMEPHKDQASRFYMMEGVKGEAVALLLLVLGVVGESLSGS